VLNVRMTGNVTVGPRLLVAVTNHGAGRRLDLKVHSRCEVSGFSQPEAPRDLHEGEYGDHTRKKLRTFAQDEVGTGVRSGALYSTEILSTDDLSQSGTRLYVRADLGRYHKLSTRGLHNTNIGLGLSCRYRLR